MFRVLGLGLYVSRARAKISLPLIGGSCLGPRSESFGSPAEIPDLSDSHRPGKQ